MTNHTNIVEKLSQFNNMSFTKKQWEIVLKGCGCPKSSHFWAALRNNNLQRNQRMYTLIDIDTISFQTIWENYCIVNRTGVKKAYLKDKAKKKVRESIKKFSGITFYMVGGALTTEIPKRD